MANSLPRIRSMWEETKWFFDNWNIFGAVAFTGIVMTAVLVGGFTTQSVLVALTALYAFFTFNQMRESKFNPRPASPLSVRPHFQIGESGSVELGLKNFGEGPALNFRLEARLVEADETIDTLTVSAKGRNLHLESSQFLSLGPGVNEDNHRWNFLDSDNSVYTGYKQRKIEFYYTFESIDGTQYPLGWSNPIEMEMDRIVSLSKSPRTVPLSEVRDKCAMQIEDMPTTDNA